MLLIFTGRKNSPHLNLCALEAAFCTEPRRELHRELDPPSTPAKETIPCSIVRHIRINRPNYSPRMAKPKANLSLS